MAPHNPPALVAARQSRGSPYQPSSLKGAPEMAR